MQTQPGEVYRLPFQIGVVLNPGTPARVESAELTDRRAAFTFPADSEPVSVVLDPGTWLLHEAGPFSRVQ